MVASASALRLSSDTCAQCAVPACLSHVISLHNRLSEFGNYRTDVYSVAAFLVLLFLTYFVLFSCRMDSITVPCGRSEERARHDVQRIADCVRSLPFCTVQ